MFLNTSIQQVLSTESLSSPAALFTAGDMSRFMDGKLQ
jgi:hypothetical protein